MARKQPPKVTVHARPRVVVLNGPNLNLLGLREPELYGRTTLAEVDVTLRARGEELGIDVECHQSNHEGILIDLLHGARATAKAVIINPGGLGHTSVALRDAVTACALPTIEVHITNTAARESFRHPAIVGGACMARIEGLGVAGYHLALLALKERLKL